MTVWPSRRRPSRRNLLKSSAAVGLAAALPAWFAQEVLGQVGPQEAGGANDTPAFALVGCGGRGRSIAREAMRFGRLVAVCDVDERHHQGAADDVFEAGGDPSQVRAYKDFRVMLEKEKDVSVVLNGTPDHWHTLVNLHALRTGRDVYTEKPLTLTIDEGKHLIKAVRENKRVLQVGSQQRSDPKFRLVCELVRNGRLGKLRRVTTFLPAGLNEGPFKTAKPPEGFDWDLWLGQAPKVAYVPERTHASFRFWLDYSGGTITDWGAHHNDIALWGLGMEHSGPVTVEGRAIVDQIPGGYTAPSQYRVKYTYANGVEHHCRSTVSESPFGAQLGEPGVGEMRIGVFFEGSDGWIYISRGGMEASDEAILNEPLPSDAQRLYESNDHMGNFFECVRSRKDPVAPVEVGHRSVSVCHLGGIAIRLGRKLQWDPEKEQFAGGDDEANSFVAREMREPWSYDAV